MANPRLTPAQARVVEALREGGTLYHTPTRGTGALRFILRKPCGQCLTLLPASLCRLQDAGVIVEGIRTKTEFGWNTTWLLAGPAAEVPTE